MVNYGIISDENKHFGVRIPYWLWMDRVSMIKYIVHCTENQGFDHINAFLLLD